MQPNQNMNNMQNRTFNRNNTPRPLQAPGYANPAVNNPNGAINPGDNVVFQDKPKKSHASLYGMIFLAILAAGGIGFGVWSMLDSNAKLAKKDETIQNLNSQLAETTQSATGSDSLENPIIKATLPAQYTIRHSIPVYVEGTNEAKMTFTSTDGGNLTCNFPNLVEAGGCSVNGISDGIYKIVTIHEGNGMGSEKVGFLMNDGTVWFAPIYNNNDANSGVIKDLQAQKMNIDGFVKDIVEISYTPDVDAQVGGGFSTVFVMSDNSIIKYDESLF